MLVPCSGQESATRNYYNLIDNASHCRVHTSGTMYNIGSRAYSLDISYIYTYMQCICNIIQFSLHSMKHEVCMEPLSSELADNLFHKQFIVSVDIFLIAMTLLS